MINSINSYNCSGKSPSFGSVVLSRVVLRTVNKDGGIEYLSLRNNEKSIVGVYQSLSRKVHSGKSKEIIAKLNAAIPDFDAKNPILYSTIIGVKSAFKRFLLTGKEAREIKDCGQDLIGALGNKSEYAKNVKNILLDYRNRVRNKQGCEIGIDLIVEGSYGHRKLVDIDVVDIDKLNRAKMPVLNPIVQEKTIVTDKPTVQREFNFLKDIQPLKEHYRD